MRLWNSRARKSTVLNMWPLGVTGFSADVAGWCEEMCTSFSTGAVRVRVPSHSC